MRSRHRISKLLLRQGIVYSDGQAWTGLHEIWLNRQPFPEPARELTYRSCLAGMRAIDERRHDLDAAITSVALDCEYTADVQCLVCLRGVSTSTAFGLAMEIGDCDRFTGSSIGAYLGLLPSEHSSAASRSRGSITKTGTLTLPAARGSGLAPPQTLPESRPADEGPVGTAPEAAQSRGHAGNRRPHQRWLTYLEHHKRPVIANVAVARELAGWCWSLAEIAEEKAPSPNPFRARRRGSAARGPYRAWT